MSHPESTEFPAGRRELYWVGGVVALALALRVAHVLFLRASPYFDQPVMDMDYHVQWARAFARGERFQEGPFFRAPLYPWFLGVCMQVFGPGLLAPRLVQALLGALTTWLTYLTGKRAFGPRAGWLASLLVATSWVLVHFDGELLIPTLIVPLDLLGLYLTLGLARDARPRRAALTGAVWGLSAIARPNVLLVMPFLAAWLLWRARPAWRAGLLAASAMALGCLAPILPITAINAARGDVALISTQAGVNFWIGNNPDSDGSTAIVPGTRGGWWEGYEDSIAQAERAEGRELAATDVSRHYSRRAWRWIRSEPGDALRHLGWKLRLYWLDVELGNNLPVAFFAGHYDPLLRLSPVGFTLLAGLGVLGLLLSRRRAAETFPLWSFLLVYSASVVAFFVCSRFRVPVLPVLALYAGAALDWGWSRARRKEWGRVALGLLVVVLAAWPTRLRPAAVVDPASNGHLLLGQAALAAGDLPTAEREFTRALQLRAASAYAQVGLAESFRRQGLLDQAEHSARSGLARLEAVHQRTGLRQPGAPELLTVLIETLLARDGEAAAVAELESLLSRDPAACHAYDVLIRLHEHAGRAGAVQRTRAARAAAGCR